MQYVFNPRNRQINPVTAMTFVDPSLRDKVVSAELYALVCKSKVSLDDVAALFAVGKSPEILLKNHAVVKDSPITKAPAATATVTENVEVPPAPGPSGTDDEKPTVSVAGAFDGRELCKKNQEELLILAGMAGVDVNAEGFAPTRPNLIKAIMAKAAAAEAGTGAPVEPATPAASPAAE